MTDSDLQHPSTALCAGCGNPLGEPHTFCTNCDAHYCLDCGRRHFCTPTCRANGCIAGLCVRVMRNGELSREWGVPSDLVESAAQ